jgi:hypothetical protein
MTVLGRGLLNRVEQPQEIPNVKKWKAFGLLASHRNEVVCARSMDVCSIQISGDGYQGTVQKAIGN